MSIFRRDSEPESPPPPYAPSVASPPVDRRNPTQSHIARGAKITGQINGTSDLVVEGELEGEVKLESNVTIGSGGLIKGNVSALSVRIGGRVVGNVRGVEKVEILNTGRLEGDVVAPRVMLAEGAFFKGKVEMTGQAPGQGAPPRRRPGQDEG
jgi:cytoskeletal protein CcmA (bactofilin family)